MKLNPLEPVHLENGCTYAECLAAARFLLDTIGKPYAPVKAAELAAHFLRMAKKDLSAPFEVRLGSETAPPLIVIHPPAGRAAGAALKQKAIEQGQWGITEPRTGVFKQSFNKN